MDGKGGKKLSVRKRKNNVWIIRWKDGIPFKDGIRNMQCIIGQEEEVKEYADKIAKEHGTKVEIIA